MYLQSQDKHTDRSYEKDEPDKFGTIALRHKQYCQSSKDNIKTNLVAQTPKWADKTFATYTLEF